jgi:hypothetical protein
LLESKSVAPDSPIYRPNTLILHCPHNDGGEVGNGGESHDGILVAVDHDGATVMEVEDGLQRLEVLRYLVWERQVVQEEAGLKQSILEDLMGQRFS